jgi:hypothetical protein
MEGLIVCGTLAGQRCLPRPAGIRRRSFLLRPIVNYSEFKSSSRPKQVLRFIERHTIDVIGGAKEITRKEPRARQPRFVATIVARPARTLRSPRSEENPILPWRSLD